MLAKRKPLELLRMPLWLARGRAWLKRRLAAEVRPDARTLPYNRKLIAHLEAEKRRGRSLIPATATDEGVANNSRGRSASSTPFSAINET